MHYELKRRINVCLFFKVALIRLYIVNCQLLILN